MMVRVKVELWLWLGQELGGGFESPTDMRSVLETDVPDGWTVRDLFDDLARHHRAIEAKVFANRQFVPAVVVIMNDRSIGAAQACDTVLKHGDKILVLPAYAGG